VISWTSIKSCTTNEYKDSIDFVVRTRGPLRQWKTTGGQQQSHAHTLPMPIYATLKLREVGQAVDHLKTCDSLRRILETAKSHDGLLYMSITELLLIEDLYGKQYPQTPEDQIVWATAASRQVLGENDFGDPEFCGHVGTWNVPLLRWLTQVAMDVAEEIEVSYDHERGDTPYESAWWAATPTNAEGAIEVFGLQSHDGMDEPEWRIEALRMSDGTTKIRKS